ncbi:hypothetical protein [Aquipseudomonas alcaligenes]|uniref:Uncharacterized protein n=1 Tax=Aquipseudomonas alcaligenes TaxID=43263 RepID=A0A1N6X948_AQUAC|nr:hypothetical protein [Pseudomonas alcaligenes]SIQ98790.1 hypothetical protein SAMN05878282_11229 [Pseudomonas alcaligenes]
MHVQGSAANQASNQTDDILSGLVQDETFGEGQGRASATNQEDEGQNESSANETHSNKMQVTSIEQAVDLGAAAIKAAKAAVKSFVSIKGFDRDAENQRVKVRELLAKQSACLEAKLHGRKSTDGEDFESVAKQLRKENNKLDAMLEGKEGMYAKVRKDIESAIGELTKMAVDLKQLEEEG